MWSGVWYIAAACIKAQLILDFVRVTDVAVHSVLPSDPAPVSTDSENGFSLAQLSSVT